MMNNNSYKELYELEKQQRARLEEKMKDIVNRIILETISVAEDSKIALLKSDMNRIQQDINRLEIAKRERMQQHLLNNGLIKEAQAFQRSDNNNGTKFNDKISTASKDYLNAFAKLQNSTNVASNNAGMSKRAGSIRCESAFRVPVAPTPQRRPASTRAPSRAPRKRKNDPPSGACFQKDLNVAAPAPLQLAEKSVSEFSSTQSAVVPVTSNITVLGQNNNIQSQQEDSADVEFVEAMEGRDLLSDKSKYYCSFCGTDCNEQTVIGHLWVHVNLIKQMYTFECTVEGCGFKSNYTKEALAHKKVAHCADENCKVVDRRDQMSEYFKQCMCKYLLRLDQLTAEQMFNSRHSDCISKSN